LLRSGLYRHRHRVAMPDFEASVEIGYQYFWANTVPYKPTGNKAWSMKVKRAFQPLIAELLVQGWQGRDVITLGREAFLWFGINQPKAVRDALDGFWRREDRFEASHVTTLTDGRGYRRELALHPLPHPSPLNATWYKHFPRLLDLRLAALEAGN
jgi:uracil-DNA glycosylase